MSEVQTVNKKKSPNFSNFEKIKLIELIERDKNIIENKKTDNVSTRDKEKCWMKITKGFNNNCISIHRDVCSLKNCWDNLKKKTRKYFAEIRSELFKTGGGKLKIIDDDPIAEKVRNIIQPSVEGLQNKFDSDNITDTNNPQYNKELGYEDSCHAVNTNDLQYNKELEYEDAHQFEVLEDENLNDSITWVEWTPAELNSEKDKELQFSNNRKNEDSLTLNNIKTVIAQSSKENCNPLSNSSSSSSSRSNFKGKKLKQFKTKAAKGNEELNNLTQSKLELVELMKEDIRRKSAIEISIFEMLLEKEKLNVEILKKQLKSYEHK